MTTVFALVGVLEILSFDGHSNLLYGRCIAVVGRLTSVPREPHSWPLGRQVGHAAGPWSRR